MLSHFWGVVVILLPVFLRVQKLVLVSLAQEGLFVFAVTLGLLLFGINRKMLTKNLLVVFPLSILAFMTFANQYDMYSLQVNWQVFNFYIGLLCFVSILTNFKNEDYERLANYIAVSCLVQCLWPIMGSFDMSIYDAVMSGWQRANAVGGKWVFGNDFEVAGALGQPTRSAVLISITGCALFRKKWLWGLPVVIWSLIILESASATIAFSLCAIYALFFRSKKAALWGIPVLGALFAYSIYFPREFLGANGRFQVWMDSLTLLKGKDILIGKGLGYYADNFPKLFKHQWNFKHAHNELLDVYVAFGLIGLTIVLYLLGNYFKHVKKGMWFVMGVALLINSVTLHTFHIAPIALIGIIILCQGLSEPRRKYGIFSY